jgi:hypothetical protein
MASRNPSASEQRLSALREIPVDAAQLARQAAETERPPTPVPQAQRHHPNHDTAGGGSSPNGTRETRSAATIMPAELNRASSRGSRQHGSNPSPPRSKSSGASSPRARLGVGQQRDEGRPSDVVRPRRGAAIRPTERSH